MGVLRSYLTRTSCGSKGTHGALEAVEREHTGERISVAPNEGDVNTVVSIAKKQVRPLRCIQCHHRPKRDKTTDAK